MATINQIKDTNGTTHDIGCKWENIIDKPEYVKTPTLHLYNENGGEYGDGGKIVFGDMSGDDLEDHENHIVCIEEIEDILNFQAAEFNFTGGYINAVDGIDCGELYSGRVETPTLHLYNGYDENGKGSQIIFGDINGYNHNGHFACIEEIEDNTLNFKASNFNFEIDEKNGGSQFKVTGTINTPTLHL